MLYVEFHGLRGNADFVLLGAIGWDGRQYSSTLPEVQTQNILADRLWEPSTEQNVDSNQPERWLNALQFHFRSVYFQAFPPKQGVRIPPPASQPGAVPGVPDARTPADPGFPQSAQM